jgi:hypothetical protein
MNIPSKFPAAASALTHRAPCSANNGAAVEAGGSTCPDCNTPLDSRFYDDEAQLSYPCDEGEHYCAGCEMIVTDEYLNATPDQAMIAEALTGWARAEEAALRWPL